MIKSSVVSFLRRILPILLLLSLPLSSCADVGSGLIISSDTYIVNVGDTVDLEEFRNRFLDDTSNVVDTAFSDEYSNTDTSDASTQVAVTPPIPPDTVPVDTTSGEDAEPVVYWVKSGDVWHIKRTCSALSRSKAVLSGSIEDAMAAGKGRVCKRCGN